MGEWMKLDPDQVDKGRMLRIKGVEINVFLSPHDVPRHVRGYYDDKLDRFVIEFNYLDDEDWKRSSQEPNLSLRLGRNSQRLLGIEANVKALKAGAVELKLHIEQAVSRAIEGLSGQFQKKAASYEAAMGVIEDRESQLFEEMVPS
jgi:hypothetical protein